VSVNVARASPDLEPWIKLFKPDTCTVLGASHWFIPNLYLDPGTYWVQIGDRPGRGGPAFKAAAYIVDYPPVVATVAEAKADSERVGLGVFSIWQRTALRRFEAGSSFRSFAQLPGTRGFDSKVDGPKLRALGSMAAMTRLEMAARSSSSMGAISSPVLGMVVVSWFALMAAATPTSAALC
jgi:hypothetical protein